MEQNLLMSVLLRALQEEKEEWDNWVRRWPEPTPNKTKHGWLVLYSHIQNYFAPPAVFGIEAFLLDLKDPSKIIARTDGPLLFHTLSKYYEKYGAVPNIIFPSGAFSRDGKLHLYYGAADTVCALATGKMDELVKELMLKRLQMSGLERYRKNPIIIPNSAHAWESKATLNTAAIYLDKNSASFVSRNVGRKHFSPRICLRVPMDLSLKSAFLSPHIFRAKILKKRSAGRELGM